MRETFVVHPDYTELKPELLRALAEFDSIGEYVSKGDRNVIKKVLVHDITINIKRFKKPNFFQALVYRYLRKSKAQRSFLYAQELIRLGINTPLPIAYFEEFSMGISTSYYISMQVEYDIDFRVLNHNPLWPNRIEILREFTEFTFKMHENGVNFLDHSPGNTLIIGKESPYTFYLIDLNRLRFESLNFKKRMHNLRRLWLSKTMINIISKKYADLYNKPNAEVQSLMTKYSRAFQKKVNSKKLRKRRKIKIKN